MLGSRILGGLALQGGMPRLEIHRQSLPHAWPKTSCWARSSPNITPATAPFRANCSSGCRWTASSDDFVFDNQVLAQIVWLGETIAEVSCPTRYEPESSSINFKRSVIYGLGCLRTALSFRLASWGWCPRTSSPTEG